MLNEHLNFAGIFPFLVNTKAQPAPRDCPLHPDQICD
jgi:hypothetical protein